MKNAINPVRAKINDAVTSLCSQVEDKYLSIWSHELSFLSVNDIIVPSVFFLGCGNSAANRNVLRVFCAVFPWSLLRFRQVQI